MMQARQLQDQAAKDSLQALRSRIYALGLVHQQLMASRDLQTFDIAPFLEELSGHIIEGGATESVQLVIDACTLNVRSEEHTSELQSLMRISYAVFCLKKNKTTSHIHALIT